jgi:hypothetical protein
VNAGSVRHALERAGIQYALIGAAAVALRGHPRFTQDTDFLTTDARVFQRSVWEELTKSGVEVDIRKGDSDDPLGGVVRIGKPPEQVDVVVGRWMWERQIIERAQHMDAFGGSVPVATRSDLILLKLAAGGYKDLVDAASLLALGPRESIVTDVNSRIGDLPAEAQAEWARLTDRETGRP